MRIAIHIDGDGANATGDTMYVSDDAPVGRAAADAGAGPGAGPGTGTDSADADDTGGPPQWLLDAVGAAEADAAAGDEADPIDDAGAGPSA